MRDTDEENALDIDDPRVPNRIREHAQRFRKPARLVVDLGAGEYVISTEDGALLDLVVLR